MIKSPTGTEILEPTKADSSPIQRIWKCLHHVLGTTPAIRNTAAKQPIYSNTKMDRAKEISELYL